MKFYDKIHDKWYYTLADLITKGGFFVLILILSYMLPTSDYAKISIFNSLVTLFFSIISLNLTNNYITKIKFDVDQKKYEEIISTIISFLILVSFVVSLIAILFYKNEYAFLNIPTKIFIYSIFVSVFHIYFDLLTTIYVVEKKRKSYLIISIIYSVSLFVFSMLLLFSFNNFGLYALIISRLFVLAAISGYSILYFHKNYALKFKIKLKLLKNAIIFSFPLLFHSLGSFVLNYLDKFMINLITTYSETAIYSFSYNLATVPFVVALATNKAFIPDFFKLITSNQILKIKDRITKDSNILYFFIIAYMSFIGLVYPLFPVAYHKGYLISQLLILNYFIFFAYNIYSNYLFYCSKTSKIFFNTFVSGLINIILNVILIKHYSYLGATFSTVVSFLILLILFHTSSNRYFDEVIELKFFLKKILSLFLFLLIQYLIYKIFFIKIIIFLSLTCYLVRIYIINKEGK